MSEPEDRQIRQAAQQAFHEIAALHDDAVKTVWEEYPAPEPRRTQRMTGETDTATGHVGTR